jgi:hypothetical protein
MEQQQHRGAAAAALVSSSGMASDLEELGSNASSTSTKSDDARTNVTSSHNLPLTRKNSKSAPSAPSFFNESLYLNVISRYKAFTRNLDRQIADREKADLKHPRSKVAPAKKQSRLKHRSAGDEHLKRFLSNVIQRYNHWAQQGRDAILEETRAGISNQKSKPVKKASKTCKDKTRSKTSAGVKKRSRHLLECTSSSSFDSGGDSRGRALKKHRRVRAVQAAHALANLHDMADNKSAIRHPVAATPANGNIDAGPLASDAADLATTATTSRRQVHSDSNILQYSRREGTNFNATSVPRYVSLSSWQVHNQNDASRNHPDSAAVSGNALLQAALLLAGASVSVTSKSSKRTGSRMPSSGGEEVNATANDGQTSELQQSPPVESNQQIPFRCFNQAGL